MNLSIALCICTFLPTSRELLAGRIKRLNRLFPYRISIIRVQIVQRKLQELLLIRPLDLAFRKLLAVRGRWWRICDLGDQIRC